MTLSLFTDQQLYDELQRRYKAKQPSPIEWTGQFALPPTLNAQTRGSAWARADSKRAWTEISRLQFQRQGCPVFPDRVWGECHYHISNLSRDDDNLAAARKPILDGAISWKRGPEKVPGFIKDDNLRILRSERPIITWIPKGEEDYVLLTFRNWSSHITD